MLMRTDPFRELDRLTQQVRANPGTPHSVSGKLIGFLAPAAVREVATTPSSSRP